MNRFLLIIFIPILLSCKANKCKDGNSRKSGFYKEQQNSYKKYKKHKNIEKRNHKCKR